MFKISNEIYLRFHRLSGTDSHHDTRARFFTLCPSEPHLHKKYKFERAWGARFGHHASRSEIYGSQVLHSVFYVLYIQITKFFPNIFIVFLVEFCLERGPFHF